MVQCDALTDPTNFLNGGAFLQTAKGNHSSAAKAMEARRESGQHGKEWARQQVKSKMEAMEARRDAHGKQGKEWVHHYQKSTLDTSSVEKCE